MSKKIISLILVISLLIGSFSLSVSAKPAGTQAALKTETKTVAEMIDYFVGSVKDNSNKTKKNAAVLKLIKTDAGEGWTLGDSSVLNKKYMAPHSQQYYQPGVPGGICNKAAAMMVLSYYREAKGYSKLPNDKKMFAELTEIFNSITKAYPGFFKNGFINENLDIRNGYEMLGTYEAGLAYYLFSKGYTATAQDVVDNISCSILRLPEAGSNLLLKFIVSFFSSWLTEKTGGKLKLSTDIKANTNDIILKSVKKGEPVIIGCLAALGNDIYAVHYFVAAGYFKMSRDIKINGKTVYTLNKEYLEVYNTWDQTSSVINWTVFKNTAMYSSISLADL